MNAILSKGDGMYLISLESADGKNLLCLRFSDWLSARVTLDIFGDEECLSIAKIKDISGCYLTEAYSGVKGVDYAFTF